MLIYIFCNDTTTLEIYTLSLHDALPIFRREAGACARRRSPAALQCLRGDPPGGRMAVREKPPSEPARGGLFRSEEHTSELQSRQYIVCRLLLEKKNTLLN